MGNTGNQRQRNTTTLQNNLQYRTVANFRRSRTPPPNNNVAKTAIGNRYYDDDIISLDKTLIDSNFQKQRQMTRIPETQGMSDEQTVRNHSILIQNIQKEKRNLNKQWIKAYIEKENQLNELKKEYEKCKKEFIQTKRENLRMQGKQNSVVIGLKKTIREQSNQIKNLQQKLHNLQNQNLTHFTTISQLSSQLGTKNHQLKLKNNQLLSLKQTLTGLQIKLQQSQQRNIQNILSISQLEKIIHEIKQKNLIIQQTNKSLKDQLQQKNNIIKNSIKNTNKLLTEKYWLECQMNEMKDQMKNMFSNDHHELSKLCIKQQYENYINSIQSQNQQLKGQIDALNKQRNKLLMDIINLKKQVMRNISSILVREDNNQNDQSILSSTDHFFTDLIKEWESTEQENKPSDID